MTNTTKIFFIVILFDKKNLSAEYFVKTFNELSFGTTKLLYDAPAEKWKFIVDRFDLAIGRIDRVTNF